MDDLKDTRAKWRTVAHTLYRMFPIIIKSAPGWMTLFVTIRLIQALIPAAHIYITSLLINEAVKVFAGSGSIAYVFMLLALQLALLLSSSVLRTMDFLSLFRVQQKLKYAINERIINKAARLPLSFFDQSASYDRLKRASSGQNGLDMVNAIMQLAQNATTIVTYLVILSAFHWLLAVALFVIVIPSLWVNLKFGGLRYAQMRSQTPIARREAYFMELLTGKAAAKELRVYGLGEHLASLWKGSYWTNAEEQFVLEKRSMRYTQWLNVMQTIMTGAISALLLGFGVAGHLTIGNYVALAQAVQQTQMLLQNVAGYVSNLYQNALFAGELLDFLSTPEQVEPSSTLLLPPTLNRGIEVGGLGFIYPGTDRRVLEDVTFAIQPGQRVAIVGENGSGKTTLVKCIIGLYPQHEGTIAYDGIPIERLGVQQLRQRVTAIFQDFVCYQLTVRENIGFGRIENMADQAMIEAAAAKAGVEEIVAALPDGYESQVGPTFGGGRDLSYGQWQRIAISRAFFRDAEVVILDEPTAALDPMAEAAVFEHFAQLTEGKTSIFISHRLGSCRHLDLILVMKDGCLVEQGTHEQLMERQGEYARMFETQAKWYQ